MKKIIHEKQYVITSQEHRIKPKNSNHGSRIIGLAADFRDDVSFIELLHHVADKVMKLAKQEGANQAEISGAIENGFSVNVRMGEVETVEYHQSNAIGLTVYFNHSTASVTTSDLSDDALTKAVKTACHIIKFTEKDPCAGLADAALMATEFHDLSLYHPWEITVEEAIEKSLNCEHEARLLDKRITNSEGVSLVTQQSQHVYANSHGFKAIEPATRHSMSCMLVAEQDGLMERDYSFTLARDHHDLLSTDALAELAVSKTVNRLGSKSISTRKAPVIFSAEVARSLIGAFLQAINGNNLYHKSSFLLDHLGKQVFSNNINLYERPFIHKGLGSSSYDAEGVATRNQHFVTHGFLERYILNSYSARQLGMQTSANAGGLHNCFVTAGELTFPELLNQMDHGLLVTELFGQGVNLVTGDYSRGAVGFWVEKGKVKYPVSGITIADNLRNMFLNVVAISNDIDRNGNIQIGSMLIEEMVIAGK